MKRSVRIVLGLSFLVSAAAFAASKKKLPTLIGGRPADPSDWPASVYATMGNARCTATVVGERTLFIAAHCVANGGTATFSVGANNYTSVCTQSADYAGNATADYALCLVDRKVTGISYENVSADLGILAVGDEITLTGYGCIQPGGGGGNDGTYRIGEGTIQRLPVTNSNDIVVQGGAALCFGDSGGPAFKYLDPGKTKRVLISINSRGDIRSVSYLVSVATAQAKRFISAYMAQTKVLICGVSPDAQGCRDMGPLPSMHCQQELAADLAAKAVSDASHDKLAACVKAL